MMEPEIIHPEDMGEVVMLGAFPEYAQVPLVVYVGAERHIIGEAVIQGSMVTATLGDDIGAEVMNMIVGRPEEAQFSIGFSEGPNPFRKFPIVHPDAALAAVLNWPEHTPENRKERRAKRKRASS